MMSCHTGQRLHGKQEPASEVSPSGDPVTPGWSSRVKGITDVKISWLSTRVLPGDHRVASPALQVALIQSGRSVVWNSIWLINTPQTVASDDKHLLSGIFSLDLCAVGDRETFLCIHVIHLSPRSLPGPVFQALRNPKGHQTSSRKSFNRNQNHQMDQSGGEKTERATRARWEEMEDEMSSLQTFVCCGDFTPMWGKNIFNQG